MAEETKTTSPNSTWRALWDEIKDAGVAAVGAYKDWQGAELTKEQAQALERQRAQPNWMAIGAIVGGVVLVVVALVLVLRRK